MQFAGFRSVIGTMWVVDDGETNKITSSFYKHMVDQAGRLDYTRAAFALNKTMRSVDVPFDQRILYIHLGAYFQYFRVFSLAPRLLAIYIADTLSIRSWTSRDMHTLRHHETSFVTGPTFIYLLSMKKLATKL